MSDMAGPPGERVDLLPPWAHASIEVVDVDPAWAGLGLRFATELDQLLDPWRTREVQHVGSTAVPGLPAKPVVDLLVPVRDLSDDGYIGALTSAGWAYVPPELDGRPEERFFVLPDEARRVAHLHLMDPGSDWVDVITFRDALRADRVLRDGYAALKRRLAVGHANDREAYTRAKASFVRAALAD